MSKTNFGKKTAVVIDVASPDGCVESLKLLGLEAVELDASDPKVTCPRIEVKTPNEAAREKLYNWMRRPFGWSIPEACGYLGIRTPLH